MTEIKITELPPADNAGPVDKLVIVQYDEDNDLDVTKQIDYMKLNTYITNEVPIGIWVDGKPIYRQIFVGDDNNPFQQNQTLITGVEHCIKQYGYIQMRRNSSAPVEREYIIPAFDQKVLGGYCNLYIDVLDNNSLKINYAGRWATCYGYIVVEYTKVSNS